MNTGCGECLEKTGNAIPAVFVIILIFWSFYVIVVELCYLKITDNIPKLVWYLTIGIILFFMMIWSYFATILTPIATVPEKYHVPESLIMKLKNSTREVDYSKALSDHMRMTDINVQTRTENGGIRYCSKCSQIKPDRSHHCSTCKVCVLKMDHHCPWTNCCISFYNYKMFLLFNFYTILYCTFAIAISIEFIYNFWMESEGRKYREIQIQAMCAVALISLVLVVSLLSYHIKLVFRNETTLEDMGETYFIYNEPLTFNISPCYNFNEVFGDNGCCWWVPTFSGRGNGCDFYTVFNSN